MRTATHEVQLLIDEDTKKFKGISLGFDFCAEHEIGIKGLLTKFNCKNIAGFSKVRTAPFNVIQDTEKYLTYSTKNKLQNCENMIFYEGIHSMWDNDDIQLTFDKTIIPSEQIKLFNDMQNNCDMCFGSYSAGLRNSFCLLKYSEIPKEHIKKVEKDAIELQKAKDKFKNSKAMNALLKAKNDFNAQLKFDDNTSWYHTPYDYFYLDVNSNFKKIWLNPKNQSYLDSGYITESDIFDWVNGKKGKIIKNKESYNYLIWECQMNAWSIMYEKRFYSGITPSKNMTWKYGEGTVYGKLLKELKGKMTEEKQNKIFDMIDATIKSEIFYHMDMYWLTYVSSKTGYVPKEVDHFPKGKNNKPLLPFIHNLPEKNQKEIEGFLYGIGTMLIALGICNVDGASNTPQIKANWSWWQNNLKQEAEYQIWCILGLIPEDYKNNSKR